MVTIDISLGELRDAGNSPLANGALLQLIASPDDTFTSPTGTSFVAGNDLVVATLALDSSTYFDLPGYTQLNQIVNLTTYPIA